MPAFKKDKKHAKEPGGIAAAVTRQAAAKFSDGHAAAGKGRPVSHAFFPSPVIHAPEIEPSPEIEPPPADDDQHAASPLLDALSAASASVSTAPSRTANWPRGGIASSPGNLINLTSESPPTLPSSYENSARPHHHWSANRPFMGPSPAPSPPNRAGRRPFSFQMEDPSHMLSSHSPRDSSSNALRRSSLQSTCTTGGRAGFHPPLPHQPQPHFYGAPDLGFTVTPQAGGIKASDCGLFFGLDKLPCMHGSPASTNVVLAGYQGGLQVYAYNKRGVHLVASLRGLRGAVHHAKILPWTANGHETTFFPLIAVVLHGPVMPPRLTWDAERGSGGASDPTSDDAASPRGRLGHQQDPLQTRTHSPFTAFQTSIEVYSLKSNKLIDVLLEAHKIPINAQVSLSSPLFQPPPPSGAFTIKADAGTVAVCSGVTGECWLYRQLSQPQNYHIFACCGKLWTTLQQNSCGEVVDDSDKAHHASTAPRLPAWQVPVFALNGRWLAYCPATPSSQMSLRAHLPVLIMGRGPGVASMTPPHLPTVSSSVDLPISDSVVNKFMRETTQELIQGARWVGQQGLHAWNAYWNKPSGPQPQQQQALSPPRPWTGSPTGSKEAAQFPSTHGAAGPAKIKEPGLVSIVDLATLANSAAIHPLTTFSTPLGCSFLSFSPSSLALFTASTKGDVQTVWDLLRIQHTHSSPLQTTLATNDSTGPLVRQIAQFSRMTVARIVDVVWTEPQGERLAMVTERGTIHLLEMPLSAFMWPLPRRRKVVPKSSPDASDAPSSAVSIASGAFGAAYQAARPFMTRSRRSSSNASVTSGNILRGSAAQGSRAIAATISHSIGKTGTALNSLRHTGENRISLPSSTVLPSAACVCWLKSRKSQAMVSVGGGLIRIFPCQNIHSTPVAGEKRLARLNRARDIKVPLLPDDVVAPIVHQILDLGAPEENLELSDNDMDTGNTMTLRAQGRTSQTVHVLDATIPQAEIESSAPYQPFHTDRRVILCEYIGNESAPHSAPIADDACSGRQHSRRRKKRPETDDALETSCFGSMSAWAFGKDIPTTRLSMNLPPAPHHENDAQPGDHMALPQSAMERVMQFGDEEQIVVTTRRRRGARQGGVDEDGFFEDDCEVLDFADQRV